MYAEKKAHVVVFAFPFASHPRPLLQLVQRLAAAATSDVRFSYFNTAASNKNLLSEVDTNSCDNIKLYDVEDGLPEEHVVSGEYPLGKKIECFIKATPENFRRRLEEVVDETGLKATCLLTDAFLGFSSEMAEEMGIPWLAVWTPGPASVSLHIYTDVIRSRLGQTVSMQNEDQTLDFLPGMSAIHVSDLPPEIINSDLPFSRLLYNMVHELPRAAAVILNSFDGIDPIVENDLKPKLQKLLNIGPSPLYMLSQMPPSDDRGGCLPWLSNRAAASVAYISFGTIMLPPPMELVALAEALEEKQIPYLWSLNDKSKRQLLGQFFERTKSIGKVVEWAPQLQVLAHSSVGLYVTHCGWNSVMESIAGGVPMICRPAFADQMINTRRVEEAWGIGVGVEGGVITKSSMMAALDVVMVKEGKKFRENIRRLRECASKAVAENGSSTEDFKSLMGIITS